MPLYDYHCAACGAEFEVERPLGATGKVRCACGSLRTSKVFSAAGIVFKGSGFHVTDYKGKSGEGQGSSKPAEAGADKSKPAAGPAAQPAPAPASPAPEKSGSND